ncbi:hypothetical protein D0864_02837 [Hortaea werneckii]|uniref:Uncharacterized protein n=1 Tax=Hortaea werneckii TaxID=91943 RepID=A0A3M7GS31_HORWE|nr:hypothetical protein KC352_g16873 [Hortaea werneckii]RMZ03961.1 hypothetical protein D0864_02837 [Hortaea werneckii]
MVGAATHDEEDPRRHESHHTADPRPPPQTRSLANIGLNNLLSNEQATSSEDDLRDAGGERIPREDARRAIGVSIGQEQTRLLSPRTPAAEKQAAIEAEGGFFGGATAVANLEEVEGGIAEEPAREREAEAGRKSLPHGTTADTAPEDAAAGRPPRPAVAPPAQDGSQDRPPSPWRSEQTRSSTTRSYLRDGFLSGRKRSSSGPDSMLGSWQKAIMSSLPSVPRNLNPFQSQAESNESASSSDTGNIPRKRSNSIWPSMSGWSERRPSPSLSRNRSDDSSKKLDLARSSASTKEKSEADAVLGDLPSRAELRTIRSRPPPQLRRSTSDNSLQTQRTLSRVSSLGDDTRWENVQEQVNSRVKAIRDSFQDSNIRLPSLPSISLKPDFFRERAGSQVRKQSEPNGTERSIDASTPTSASRAPSSSARATMGDSNAQKAAAQHPNFNRALEQLEGDVVILGGYRGSILRSAEPPHRQVWVPIKVGLNIRKVDLELGLDEEDDERATEKIIPGGMLSHIGPVDISRRLFKRLRTCENARTGKLRVHDFGYDWRLHPTYLSQQLVKFLASLPCNQPGTPKEKRGALVIPHSLGGLITRHAVNQRPELFSGVVYAGVPNTCVNILGPLRNGDEVLLSSKVLTAQVNFTIRTSFALLPLDGRCFFDKNTREEYRVDFFDPQTWIDYRFSPCIARPLPPLYAQPKPAGITGYVSSVANALPKPGRKNSIRRNAAHPADPTKATAVAGAAEPDAKATDQATSHQALAENNIDTSGKNHDPSTDTAAGVRTAVTIPRDQALAYLTRTLATVKKFKQQLAFHPPHATNNAYPPISVIFGKSTPTVYGAKVSGREGIKHADAYDELAFASGDGVVLARAAMVPEGYQTAPGGVVSSDRGHVTILGDLEAVGKCVNAVLAARRGGMGVGVGG